jgi:hypothetical protein
VGAWSISSSLTVRAGVNGAHQFPDSDRISTSPTGELPGPERARHVDLGVEQRIGATWRWHVSAYARGERDVLRQQRAETRLVDGALIERDALPVWRNTLAVSARGLELVVQRRATSGLSGWIGYAYGRARAEDALTGETYWADFDQRHSLNAYGMVRMSTKTSVSTRLRLGSNFPVPGYFTREGLRLFLADRRNEVRLPVYALPSAFSARPAPAPSCPAATCSDYAWLAAWRGPSRPGNAARGRSAAHRQRANA